MSIQTIKTNRKGFTLVELIIVITILAILGSIWFVSFQWYTANARNSKRTNDITSIISALETKRAGNALNITQFVSSNFWAAGLSNAAGTAPEISLAWQSITATWTKYDAWFVDFALLWISATDFKDPNNSNYSFAATELKWWQFQLAASFEWSKAKALVKWNYWARTQVAVPVTLDSRDNTRLVITNTKDFWKFFVWDIITWTTWWNSIVEISEDLMYLTMNAPVTAATSIQLASNESLALIWDRSNQTSSGSNTPVVDKWSALPY